jgi:hypothetical protein
MFESKQERNALIANLYFEGKTHREIITELRGRGYRDLKDTRSLSRVISKLKEKGVIPTKRPDLTGTEKEWLWEIGQIFGRIKVVPVGRRRKEKQVGE